ncbi:MAG: phosphodiesterase [Spirochaetaceae bacterium]|jgi:putative phosphoesterase|nr:phosphodiesterase [Spirochaetaceae bacterium]
MIISDLHGSFEWTEKALAQFEASKADCLIILGDILYHGPRNNLPSGHDPKQAADLLNKYADKIIAVRGNCEAEVDALVLKFPCMSDYLLLVDGGRKLFLTHGHLFNEDDLPFAIGKGGVYMCGHTHVFRLEEKNGIVFCNPGSISLPKTNLPGEIPMHSYALFEKNNISIFNLDKPCEVLKTINLEIVKTEE